MATIQDLIRQLNQRPFVQVRVNKRVVPHIVTAHVELGYDMATPTATFQVAQTAAPFWSEEDDVRIDMGYTGPGGLILPVFAGLIEADNRRYAPRMLDVQASGFSKKLQRPYGNVALDEIEGPTPVFSYSNTTDSDMWSDLMRRAGVPRYSSGDGDGLTYATRAPYDVQAGTKLGDIVSKLDESSKSGQRTFEVAGVVLRKAVLGVPSVNVVWRYAEGVQGLTDPFLPIIDISRNVADKDIQNQAIVKGIGVASETDTTASPIQASVQAVNDKLGKDGDGNDIYVPHNLSSDFLETREQCTDVAQRYMIEFNKLTDDLTVRVALNPSIYPGQSIGIVSAKMDINNQRPYWVRHVSHDIGSGGAFTTLQCEGGAGPQGYLIGLAPIAAFEMFVTREVFEVGGILDTWYTVTCDGSASFDADGPIASYAWFASNGSTGSGVTWQVRFNQAQWDDPDTIIRLTVTDSDTDPTGPHHNILEQSPTGAESDDTQIDGIYIAGNGRADATADGGLTWGTWPADSGAHIVCVNRLAAGAAYFGLDDGRLIYTEDHLETPPTLVHSFPAGVTAVWPSEVDSTKVVVGLQNGDVWLTLDAFATPPTMRRNFSWPINWITGSIEQITQWRVATGSYVWITYDDFATVGTLSTQANTVEQIELSNYANYNVESVDANVKIETVGVSLTYPTLSPPPTRARLAHFLRTDEMMAGDDQGRTFVKLPDTNAFVSATAIGAGRVNGLIASRTNPKVFYAACDDGLYKTYDAALSWYRVRPYTDDGMDALQIGMDSEPVGIKIVAALHELVGVAYFQASGGQPAYGGPTIPVRVLPGREWTVDMGVANGWAKALDYDQDTGTPNPPEGSFANFWTLAYDDSAWEPVQLAFGNSVGAEILPRTRTLGAKPRPENIVQQGVYAMFRHVFHTAVAPDGFQKAILTAFAWLSLEKVWFNGVQVHGPGNTREAQHSHSPTTQLSVWSGGGGYMHPMDGVYYMDVTDLITQDADNIIAGYCLSRSGGIVAEAFSYRLSYNTNTTLSVVTAGPGALYITTIEESKALMLFDLPKLNRTHGNDPPYLTDPPAGWQQNGFDDSAWSHAVTQRGLYDNENLDDPGQSLLHGSMLLSATPDLPSEQYAWGVGYGAAIRQHWQIPEGEYTSALLSLRWQHTITVWLNGDLVFQDNSDNAPYPGDISVFQPGPQYAGKRSEMLNIDVLQYLKPGFDNVLAILVQRADVYPGGWHAIADAVWANAIMEVI